MPKIQLQSWEYCTPLFTSLKKIVELTYPCVPPKNLLTQPSSIRSQTCVRLWHMCMMWFPIFMHDYSYQIDMDLKRPKTLLTLTFLFFQGRMALLVTLFLVLVNIFNAITNNSPKADGLNALQVSKKFTYFSSPLM